jgi:serine/threonine-protein kinase RsbW
MNPCTIPQVLYELIVTGEKNRNPGGWEYPSGENQVEWESNELRSTGRESYPSAGGAMATSNHLECEFRESRLIWRYQKVLPARVEAISPIVEHIMKQTEEMGCSTGKELAIETALREALANAIIHGCHGDPDLEIQVCVGCDPEKGILIVVKNPGTGFDPTQIPNPTRGENVFSSHGRGIYLINQLMDEVQFKNQGTEIHMRKR